MGSNVSTRRTYPSDVARASRAALTSRLTTSFTRRQLEERIARSQRVYMNLQTNIGSFIGIGMDFLVGVSMWVARCLVDTIFARNSGDFIVIYDDIVGDVSLIVGTFSVTAAWIFNDNKSGYLTTIEMLSSMMLVDLYVVWFQLDYHPSAAACHLKNHRTALPRNSLCPVALAGRFNKRHCLTSMGNPVLKKRSHISRHPF